MGINSTAILLPFGWPFGVPLFYRVTIGKSDRLLDTLLASRVIVPVSAMGIVSQDLHADVIRNH